ncbi:MAG: hypothetical protein GEU73_11520 [Chloroflexi bacterium]|nr:hypothetical protein [Chloroflexota bacterium]
MSDGVQIYAGTHEGLLVFRSSDGGWRETTRAFDGAIIDSIAGCQRHPERVYCGVTHDGLYRTEDAGLHWDKVLDGDIRAVAVDATDDSIYAGAEPVHLFRSEDRGDSWEEVESLLQMPEEIRQKWWSPVSGVGHVRHVFVHPDDPNTIYLALEHGGIVRSFDRGATWQDVTNGINYIDIHMVASLPGSFTHYYTSSARGFFTAQDPAEGWIRAENGFTRDYFHDFVFLPLHQGSTYPTMLIGTADKSPGSWNRPERARSAVFRSDDGAQTWHRVGEGLPEVITSMISTVVSHPLDKNAAFIGFGEVSRGHAHGPAGPGQILVTRDRGDSWHDLNLEMPADRVLWVAPE